MISQEILQQRINEANQLLSKIGELIGKVAEVIEAANDPAMKARVEALGDQMFDLQTKLVAHHQITQDEMVLWFKSFGLNARG